MRKCTVSSYEYMRVCLCAHKVRACVSVCVSAYVGIWNCEDAHQCEYVSTSICVNLWDVCACKSVNMAVCTSVDVHKCVYECACVQGCLCLCECTRVCTFLTGHSQEGSLRGGCHWFLLLPFCLQIPS